MGKGTVIEKYTIKDKIGEGGMGRVYLAHDNSLNRDVAIKKLLVDPNQIMDDEQRHEIVTRFQQEAQAAARLNHPNIITIYEVIQSGDSNQIVMELLKGESLQKWLREKHAFNTLEIIKIGIQICDGLAYAHQAGIIHRDIKPDNIFLLDNLTVKITDFGVARVDTDALIKTMANQFMGTPHYSSPEQWKDTSSVDGRSDIYSLGIVLYQLFTGKLPFTASNFSELMNKVLTGSPASIREISPLISQDIENMVMKAISREPDQRFQSGKEMADALRASLTTTQNVTSTPTISVSPASESRQQSQVKVQEPDASVLKESFTTVIQNLNLDSFSWVVSVFNGWNRREVTSGPIRSILDHLLDIPMHTDPFSGALLIDSRYLLLIWQGVILQALDMETNSIRDAAFDSLPENGKSLSLFTPGHTQNANLPLVLSTILDEQKEIHHDLDSAVIDIAGLIKKLTEEKFTGAVRLRYAEGSIYFGFFSGSRIFILQSSSLKLDLSSTTLAKLTKLVKHKPFKVDVFETQFDPLRESRRRLLKGVSLSMLHVPDAKLSHTTIIKHKTRDYHPTILKELQESFQLDATLEESRSFQWGEHKTSVKELLPNDFGFRFSQWFISDFFLSLISSGNRDSMKYVCTWIPEIATIKLNHFVKDAQGREHFFDIVTMDQKGKILHLVYRGKNGELDQVTQFIESVTALKKHLIKQGDIGGALYVSPVNFSDESMEYYHKRTAEKKTRFGIGTLDKLTGYKGFLRISKSRGFHFCVVTETKSAFRLIGPVL